MKIKLTNQDITTIEVDVIVNAANTSLMGGGGVDGAIHRAGGAAILEECVKIRNAQGGCKVGEAVMTTAGNLPAQYVIHTVGPMWQNGNRNEEELLANCYINTLKLAKENNCKKIAFPNISTGIYKFHKQKAAEIAIKIISQEPDFEEIIFTCFDKENFDIYKTLLSNLKS